jgi:hypothetical protein
MGERKGYVSPLENILKKDVWGKYTKDIKALKKWPYWSLFTKVLSSLNRDALFKSPVHGVGHIERTMLHGAMASMDNGLDFEDTRLLLTCCAYHDTGRVSDWQDASHGRNSAFKLHDLTGADGDDLQMMMAATEAHSRHDADLDRILSSYPVQSMPRCRELALFLKDCDGLDRVRLSDLDAGYLRHPAAAKRVDFAKFLFSLYTKEQELLGMETAKPIDYFHIQLVKNTRDSVNSELSRGKCASETVLSRLGVLMDTDISGLCPSLSCRHGLENNLCGAYTGACAFVDIISGQDGSPRRREFAEQFLKQYKSDVCRNLRPSGIDENDSAHTCAALILDVILFTYKFLNGEGR